MKDQRGETFLEIGTTYIKPGIKPGGPGAFGNRRGVTLVELLIVLAVIGIIVALAAPEIGDYKTTIDANRAASDMQSDMQLARTGAIFKNKYYRITFYTTADVDGLYYYTMDRIALGESWAADAEFVKTNTFPSGIEYGLFGSVTGPGGASVPGDGISFTGNYIIFESTGSVDKTGFVYVMPQKDRADFRTDRMRAIKIAFKPTAKVKSYRYSGATWTDETEWSGF